MTIKEHKERHLQLHRSFDELIADFIHNTSNSLSKTSILDLVEWSYKQTLDPDNPNQSKETKWEVGLHTPSKQ